MSRSQTGASFILLGQEEGDKRKRQLDRENKDSCRDRMAAEAATTMAAAEQKLNGLDEQQLNGCEFDPNAVVDEDDLKKLRPPDIDADVRDMERRRRVEVMMGSRTFRDDLERIVDQQLREGGAAGLFALQQHISDLTGMGNTHPFFLPTPHSHKSSGNCR